MSNKSWKNNNDLYKMKEDWEPNHDMYKDMAYDAVADLIMNSPHMSDILDVIGETAANAAGMWNHDIIDQEFYDLVNEDFSKPIYQALTIMFSSVEKRAKELGYENPNMQGPFNG